MSQASPTGDRTDARQAGESRGTRLTIALLGLIMVASAALGLWYLPAADRQSVEGPGIENLEAKLTGAEIRHRGGSAIAWYPQLVALRLADRLQEATRTETLHVVTAKGRLTRRGRNVARGFSPLFGVAGIFLLYRIARRLQSRGVALLAALILCFSPWHIQASVLFAPQILVSCLLALAVWLALRALDRPSPARLALVGLALGVAAAVEPAAAWVTAPVALGLVFGGGRQPARMVMPLVITVPVALAAWWLLAPPGPLLTEALEVERATAARRAAKELSSRFTVAVFGFLYPLRESVHGPVFGTLALLAAAGQAFRCLFLLDAGPDRVHRLVVLGAPAAFILATAAGTPLFREILFVPLVAFSSLFAAVMLGDLWDGLVALVPRLRSPLAGLAAAAVVAVLVVPAGWRYVHPKAVGSTFGAALDWIRKDLPARVPSLVVVEEAALAGRPEAVTQLAQGIGVLTVPRLAAMDAQRLARADGEMFLRNELAGADAAFYRSRREQGHHRPVTSNLLWRRGPDLLAVVRPFGDGSPERVILEPQPNGETWRAAVPATTDGSALVSLVLELSATSAAAPAAPRARLGEADLQLVPAGRVSRRSLFVSERLPGAAARRVLVVETPPWMSAQRGKMKVSMYVWRSPDVISSEP